MNIQTSAFNLCMPQLHMLLLGRCMPCCVIAKNLFGFLFQKSKPHTRSWVLRSFPAMADKIWQQLCAAESRRLIIFTCRPKLGRSWAQSCRPQSVHTVMLSCLCTRIGCFKQVKLGVRERPLGGERPMHCPLRRCLGQKHAPLLLPCMFVRIQVSLAFDRRSSELSAPMTGVACPCQMG